MIFPVGIAIFSAAKGNSTGLFFAVAFFVPALVYSAFRFFTLRYKIDKGELVVKQGLFFRRVRTVPINRIQNIDLVQNPLHRLFRVAEVRIETASGTEPEAILRVLSMGKLSELRDQIFADHKFSNTTAAVLAGADSDSGLTINVAEQSVRSTHRSANGVTLLEIPGRWLLKAGIASNKGMLLIGILYGAWYQFDLEEQIDLDRIKKALPTLDGSIVNTLKIIALVFAVLALLRLFSVIWFFLRFHGYRLTLYGEDLRISCGLFTKISATVPRNRIQFISIHRPLFLRWFGLASFRIETAGGGGMSKSATNSVSRRWFIPVVAEDRIAELVNYLRPGLVWNEHSLDWKSLASGTAKRLMRLAAIQSLVVAGTGFAISRPWGGMAGLVILPLALLWARKKSRAMRYVRSEDYVVYRSGIFNRKTSLTFFDKVQTVGVKQTPFDRRWKMATLFVDTAASGPAEHSICVRYLDHAFAHEEFATISTVASRHQPEFD